MVLPRGSGDFYHRFRPRTFDEVVGHKDVINSLRHIPLSEDSAQAYLFTGASGCGKTTSARILAAAVNCENLSDIGNPCTKCRSCRQIIAGTNTDIYEMNAAETRGIDDIREIGKQASFRPFFTNNKVFILDEAHALTTAAQQSLLKIMEEVPKNVFIILCSTDPKKIIPTLRNRCQTFNFPKLKPGEIRLLIKSVWSLEGFPDNYPIISKAFESIVSFSEGSARSSLVALQQLAQAVSSPGGVDVLTEETLQSLFESVDEESSAAIDICRALMAKGSWKSMAVLISQNTSTPETIRMSVLGYFRKCLLNPRSVADADKFSSVLELFISPWYDSKPENNLVLSLYRAAKVMRG